MIEYYGYIYKVTNLVNSKVYVGQRKGSFDRHYLGSGRLIEAAVKKYGKSRFKVEILEYALTVGKLNEAEIRLISEYRKLLGKEGVYNISKGGGDYVESSFNKRDWNGSEAQREHARQMMLDRYAEDPNWNKESSRRGRETRLRKSEVDPEFRERILKGLEKGRSLLPEVREKKSKSGKLKALRLMQDPVYAKGMSEWGQAFGLASGRNKIVVIAVLVLKSGLEFNEKSWDSVRLKKAPNYPRFGSIFKYFSTIQELQEVAKQHKNYLEEVNA